MPRSRIKTLSLRGKLAALMFVVATFAAALGAGLAVWLQSLPLAVTLSAAVLLLPILWLAARILQPIQRLLRGLAGTVASYREGDFSRSLVVERNDELGELMIAHNELATALRAQRTHLVQRELLLDTVMQNSPVALVLVDAQTRVTYANLAARQLFSDGRSLTGLKFEDSLAGAPPAMRRATEEQADSLFSSEIDGIEETFHLSQRAFVLQGKPYRLYLLKRLTRELSRQEVSTWKKLIRVLSHELNNSLGPLSSLAHTGAEIARRGEYATLPTVFAAIAERAEHLHQFVSGYAAFAKLPAPRPEPVEWPALLADLARHHAFRLAKTPPARAGWFDRTQVEQALINLLKNAHEAGGLPEDIELEVTNLGDGHRIEVRDRGSGMNPTVLGQALLPFYSTKRSGTGLGLALAREIAEAHGGRIQLANREGGGLSVAMDLPVPVDENRLTDHP